MSATDDIINMIPPIIAVGLVGKTAGWTLKNMPKVKWK